MRKRFRSVLENEVLETLASDDDLEEELSSMMAAFAT